MVQFYKMLSGFCFMNGTSSPRAACNLVSYTGFICHCHIPLLEPAAKLGISDQQDWLKYILCPFHLKKYSKLLSQPNNSFNVSKYLVRLNVFKAQPCMFLVYLQIGVSGSAKGKRLWGH